MKTSSSRIGSLLLAVALACGSAACAAAVSAARKRLTGRVVNVTLPGGTLHVEWAADNHIRMTGPVEFEYEGVIDFSKLVKVSV